MNETIRSMLEATEKIAERGNYPIRELRKYVDISSGPMYINFNKLTKMGLTKRKDKKKTVHYIGGLTKKGKEVLENLNDIKRIWENGERKI